MKAQLFSGLLVALALLTVGCGIEPATLESLRDVVMTASAATEDQLPPEIESEVVEFEPPNPDRVDPFTFPAGSTLAADQPGTSITTAAQVDVLGFANVDGPRVFLRTKDIIKSLAVGESTDGVEVEGIHPPAVDLRMGSLRWRATMFDRSSSDRN